MSSLCRMIASVARTGKSRFGPEGQAWILPGKQEDRPAEPQLSDTYKSSSILPGPLRHPFPMTGLAGGSLQAAKQLSHGPAAQTMIGNPWGRAGACRGFLQRSLGSYYLNWFGSDRQMTDAIIVLNVIIFLLELSDPGVIRNFAQVNILLAAHGSEFYRLLTAAFLHGGVLHLLGNMLSLHYMGPSVEQVLGRPAFLAVYLASAASGGFMHYMMGPAYGTLMGASGAVVGIMASTLVYKLRNRKFMPLTPDDFNWIAQIVLINAALAMFMSSISHWGHLGGFLGGGLAMFLFGPRYRWGSHGIANQPLIPVFKLP